MVSCQCRPTWLIYDWWHVNKATGIHENISLQHSIRTQLLTSQLKILWTKFCFKNNAESNFGFRTECGANLQVELDSYLNLFSLKFQILMFPMHFLLKMLAASRIHLFATHLEPRSTGQPPWSIAISERPLLFMLYQKTALPFVGGIAIPRRGNAV